MSERPRRRSVVIGRQSTTAILHPQTPPGTFLAVAQHDLARISIREGVLGSVRNQLICDESERFRPHRLRSYRCISTLTTCRKERLQHLTKLLEMRGRLDSCDGTRKHLQAVMHESKVIDTRHSPRPSSSRRVGSGSRRAWK